MHTHARATQTSIESNLDLLLKATQAMRATQAKVSRCFEDLRDVKSRMEKMLSPFARKSVSVKVMKACGNAATQSAEVVAQ